MTPEALLTLAVVAGVLVALYLDLWGPDITVFSGVAVLLLTGVLTPGEAFAGFGNAGMLTVAALFVVAYAVQASGGLEWFAGRVMGVPTGGRSAVLRVMLPIVGLSAFLNNTPVVAMFIPTVRDWALRHRMAPSKLLIPLSYAAIFGGTCTLIGTSTNIVVNAMLQEATGRSLGMFDIALVGVPSAVAGILYMWSAGYALLPDNRDLSADFRRGGREYLLEMRVPAQSPIAGKTVEAAGLRHLEDLFLVEIHRDGEVLSPVGPTEALQGGDHLLFTGSASGVVQVQKLAGLEPVHDQELHRALRDSGSGRLVEAVVSRSSPMLGKTIREGNFRGRYDAAILAVHRHGELLRPPLGTAVLRPGDTLILAAGDDFAKRWNHSREFYMVSRLGEMPAFNRRKAALSLGVLATFVGLAAAGVLDILTGAAVGAALLVVTRCITAVEARRALEINVLVVIAGSFGISAALVKTGAAGFLARTIVGAGEGYGPFALLLAVYLVTALLTELITNNAAAVLVFPVAASVASQAGLDPVPFAVAVAVAASASFSTPVGYQTNMMVYGPGGYRFRDFLRVGLPLNALFMALSMAIIPAVWGL